MLGLLDACCRCQGRADRNGQGPIGGVMMERRYAEFALESECVSRYYVWDAVVRITHCYIALLITGFYDFDLTYGDVIYDYLTDK